MSTYQVDQAFFFGFLVGAAISAAVMMVLWALFDHFFRVPKPRLRVVPIPTDATGRMVLPGGPVPPARTIPGQPHQRNGSTREQAQAPTV